MRVLDRLVELRLSVRLLIVTVVTLGAAGFAFALDASIEQASLGLIVTVVFSAGAGKLPGLYAAALAAAILNLAFTPPLWTLRVGNGDDTVALVAFGAMALVVSSMVTRVAGLRAAAEQRANEAAEAARQQVRLAREADQARAAAELSRTRAGLLSAVSHNLRTPLAAIQASASTLLSEGQHLDETDREELLHTVHDEVVRLSGLVSKLLDLGRIRAGGLEIDPQTIDVHGLLHAAMHRVKPLLGSRTVSVSVSENASECEADPVAVEQILLNLLENALRYTPDASPIEIHAARHRGAIDIQVIDHGPGVDPGAHEAIFEEFVRADERYESEGTGLGLAIAKAYAAAHRGRLWVSSTDGGGATFTLRLPVVFER